MTTAVIFWLGMAVEAALAIGLILLVPLRAMDERPEWRDDNE